MASISKRSNGKWQAQVRKVGGKPVSKTFSRKGDAERWTKKIESQIEKGFVSAIEAERHTLAQAIDRYIDHLSSRRTDTYGQIAKLNWFKDEVGHLPLSQVSPAVITECKSNLRDRKGRGGALAGSTINRYMASLSNVFKSAIAEWQWCNSNPVRHVQREPEPAKMVRFLDLDERNALLAACNGDRCEHIELVVMIALATGMRKSEILYLIWDDIDIERRQIVLRKTKNGKPRTVPISGDVLKALSDLKSSAKVRSLENDWIFPRKDGDHSKPYDSDTPWRRVRKAASLNDFRFHDLRHTTASYLAMNGASAFEIQAVLGHSSPAMASRYSHIGPQHTAGLMERMNEKFLRIS